MLVVLWPTIANVNQQLSRSNHLLSLRGLKHTQPVCMRVDVCRHTCMHVCGNCKVHGRYACMCTCTGQTLTHRCTHNWKYALTRTWPWKTTTEARQRYTRTQAQIHTKTQTHTRSTHVYMHIHMHKQQSNKHTQIDMNNHMHKQQDTHFTITWSQSQRHNQPRVAHVY